MLLLSLAPKDSRLLTEPGPDGGLEGGESLTIDDTEGSGSMVTLSSSEQNKTKPQNNYNSL